MTSSTVDDFDWAAAIYALAIDQSATVDEMAEAARLDPRGGDVSDIDLSELE
jgi:hypothetical protein